MELYSSIMALLADKRWKYKLVMLWLRYRLSFILLRFAITTQGTPELYQSIVKAINRLSYLLLRVIIPQHDTFRTLWSQYNSYHHNWSMVKCSMVHLHCPISSCFGLPPAVCDILMESSNYHWWYDEFVTNPPKLGSYYSSAKTRLAPPAFIL